VNADCDLTRFVGRAFGGPVVIFGENDYADLRADVKSINATGTRFTIGRHAFHLGVPGRHNVLNALAALGVCDALGVRLSRCATPLAKFRLPAMRLERQVIGGVVVINDAYNSNPESAIAAINAFSLECAPGRRILILGDMLELGDASAASHEEVGRIAGENLDYVIAVGEFSGHVQRGAISAGMGRHNVTAVGTRDEASDILRAVSRPGDMILIKGSRKMQLENLVSDIAA
jgi:UDP-N-acetylmuramoyl-tripeptide--D-alanyl-D-alanine ligase